MLDNKMEIGFLGGLGIALGIVLGVGIIYGIVKNWEIIKVLAIIGGIILLVIIVIVIFAKLSSSRY